MSFMFMHKLLAKGQNLIDYLILNIPSIIQLNPLPSCSKDNEETENLLKELNSSNKEIKFEVLS